VLGETGRILHEHISGALEEAFDVPCVCQREEKVDSSLLLTDDGARLAMTTRAPEPDAALVAAPGSRWSAFDGSNLDIVRG
jgi:hypothetical protein